MQTVSKFLSHSPVSQPLQSLYMTARMDSMLTLTKLFHSSTTKKLSEVQQSSLYSQSEHTHMRRLPTGHLINSSTRSSLSTCRPLFYLPTPLNLIWLMITHPPNLWQWIQNQRFNCLTSQTREWMTEQLMMRIIVYSTAQRISVNSYNLIIFLYFLMM